MIRIDEDKRVNDMEYLVTELKKEWNRSGKTTSSVCIELKEISEVNQMLVKEILDKQKLLKIKDLTFRDDMTLSRESYILFRLVEKIKAGEEKAKKKGAMIGFNVLLDQEEFNMFEECLVRRIYSVWR